MTIDDIAKMFDLSCVRMFNTKDDVKDLINAAIKYNCGHVSVLQCFVEYAKELLGKKSNIKLVGNVSFPSGSDSTELKVIQAKQLVKKCDEIDMVMNVNWHLSGMYNEVKNDIVQVKEAVEELPLKVIIEASLLSKNQIKKACEICVNAGVTFIKTGTGWSEPTTIEQVNLIKSIVGDSILIKASGGIKDLETLIELYKSGARRFGINLKNGLSILQQCKNKGGIIEF
ncbi:MAG: deoxyribose-phosphate aldolase [Actinobacteria bacterium]|nr:deoxyribose-phosphate aldolase [Actinomycetota bacterium]